MIATTNATVTLKRRYVVTLTKLLDLKQSKRGLLLSGNVVHICSAQGLFFTVESVNSNKTLKYLHFEFRQTHFYRL